MNFKIIVAIFSLLLVNCTGTFDRHWQQKKIDATLHKVFVDADSILILNGSLATADQQDSADMPPPVYKAIIKFAGADNPGFIFYFYEDDITDTAFFSSLFKPVFVTLLKAGFGTKKPQYVWSFPHYDTSGNNRVLVYGMNVNMKKDSAYLVKAEDCFIKDFGLKKMKIDLKGNKKDSLPGR